MATEQPESSFLHHHQVAAVGFRVMYDVGQQQDDCGDPHKNTTKVRKHTLLLSHFHL